jgi:hypothetical protein
VTAKLLCVQFSEEVSRPGGILGHFNCDLLVQPFAAGLEHEFMSPYLKYFHALQLLAQQTWLASNLS